MRRSSPKSAGACKSGVSDWGFAVVGLKQQHTWSSSAASSSVTLNSVHRQPDAASAASWIVSESKQNVVHMACQ